ncbi:hypothetical protein Tco_0900940 [Tanacetum coccineum]
MAYSSSSSNANSKVHTCSTECEQSYAQLKKLYDTQREQLGDASIEIQAYTQALKKLDATVNPSLRNGESDSEDDEYCGQSLRSSNTMTKDDSGFEAAVTFSVTKDVVRRTQRCFHEKFHALAVISR